MIVVFLIVSNFITIEVGSGANYLTKDTLLGLLIFHSPWVLGFYVLVILGLVYYGLGRLK